MRFTSNMVTENFTEESLEDYPRGTMRVLPLSLERGDGNAHACATAVLRSAFDHLFSALLFEGQELSCWERHLLDCARLAA
jgi:hypothetical protein